MSKERARRRADREREQAIRAAARAREAELQQRRTMRRRTVTGWLPRPRVQPGILAARRRRQGAATVAILLAINLLVLVLVPEWSARIGILLVSILAAPVLHTLLFRR